MEVVQRHSSRIELRVPDVTLPPENRERWSPHDEVDQAIRDNMFLVASMFKILRATPVFFSR